MKRFIYLLGFLVCVALLAAAYYFQYAKGLEPCPLCIMQRLAYYLIGLTCLIAFLHSPRQRGQRIYAVLLICFAVFGIGIACRQIYLQHLPPEQAPACSPALNFMLHNYPFHQVLQVLFYGSGDCSVVHWQFLGLAMSEWSLIFLLAFLFTAVVLLFRKQ
jgi:protein dithiol:quinone oxidoreductase